VDAGCGFSISQRLRETVIGKGKNTLRRTKTAMMAEMAEMAVFEMKLQDRQAWRRWRSSILPLLLLLLKRLI